MAPRREQLSIGQVQCARVRCTDGGTALRLLDDRCRGGLGARRPRIIMRGSVVLLSLVLAPQLAFGVPPPGRVPPAWAYPVNPPNLPVPADDGTPLHVPDSDAAFTLSQIL